MDDAPSIKKWELTQEAFDRLLLQFDRDPDEAGIKYENSRIKLVKFFERRALPAADDRADEVINIVTRQISEGKIIENINAYLLAVAKRHVLTVTRGPAMDSLEEPEQIAASTDNSPDRLLVASEEEDIQETRLKYLEHCLEKIGEQHRTLILGYYREEKQAKIDNRRSLAESFGIDLNALRIRVCRIRMKLERCVNECVAREAGFKKTGRAVKRVD